MKKITLRLSLLIALCMMLTIWAFAKNSEPEQCVKDYYSAMGNDWDTVANLTCSLDREDTEAWIIKSKPDHSGLLNIKSSEIKSITELPYDDPSIYSVTYQSELRFGKDLKAFIVELDLDVYKEKSYEINGENIYYVVLNEEMDGWKIARTGVASPKPIEKVFPKEVRTEEQEKQIKLYNLWSNHLMTANSHGEILDYGGVYLEPFRNFQKIDKREYNDGDFSDVDENAWYGSINEGTLKEAYELAILNGKGEEIMDPDGSLTIAEAIKIADMVNKVFKEKDLSFETSNPWYKTYIDYALDNGIVKEDDNFDYNAKATRAQVAYIFANSVPQSALEDINEIVNIPDIDETTSFYKSVLELYRAGVLKGNDSEGYFRPDDTITRAEATQLYYV